MSKKRKTVWIVEKKRKFKGANINIKSAYSTREKFIEALKKSERENIIDDLCIAEQSCDLYVYCSFSFLSEVIKYDI